MKIIFLIVLQIFTVGAIQIRAQDVPPIQCSLLQCAPTWPTKFRRKF